MTRRNPRALADDLSEVTDAYMRRKEKTSMRVFHVDDAIVVDIDSLVGTWREDGDLKDLSNIQKFDEMVNKIAEALDKHLIRSSKNDFTYRRIEHFFVISMEAVIGVWREDVEEVDAISEDGPPQA